MSAQACVWVCVCACVGPKHFAHLFMGLAQREGSKKWQAEAADEADEPQNAPTGGKNRTWCTSWFGHPPPPPPLLVGKGFFPNCTIPMRIHLCKLPSGHVHCIEKERKKIFKYFLWLNKTFLLNSSSRISNANRMQAALFHFSSPLWGFTIWNVFELQLPIVHEVCLSLFLSSLPCPNST